MSSKMARQAKGQAKVMGVVTSKGAPKLKLGTESVLDIFDDDTRRGKRKQLKKVTIVPKLTDESDPAHPKFGQAKEKPPKLGKSKAKLAMRKEIAKQYADFDRELHRTLVVSWILVVLGAAEVVCGSIIWDWDIPYTNNGFHRGAWWAGTLAFSSGVCGVLTYRSQVRCPFPHGARSGALLWPSPHYHHHRPSPHHHHRLPTAHVRARAGTPQARCLGKLFSLLCLFTMAVNGIIGPISDCSSFEPMDYLAVYGYASCGLCLTTSMLAGLGMLWSAMWPVVQVAHYLTFEERQVIDESGSDVCV